jgi:hypothetical protein
VVPGDARISLEREAAGQDLAPFDLLVLDTFSGDSIPLHLLTTEAFQTYLGRLSPKGIPAVNVSNRYFNLPLEVYRLADHFGLAAAMLEDHGDGVKSLDSVWMLLSRDPGVLAQPAIAARTSPRPAIPASLVAWTDNFSNLLQFVK